MVLAIAVGLRQAGIDAVAAAEIRDLRGLADEALLDLAAEQRCVLVTRDVTSMRLLLRDRWARGVPTWGAIFISSAVPSSRRGSAVVQRALLAIASSEPGDVPLPYEVWITAGS